MRPRRFLIRLPGETAIDPPEAPQWPEFGELFPGKVPGGAFLKRTVSVYSADPSPNRNPQFRQNRSSLGIGEWQFPQAVTAGLSSDFIDISLKDFQHHGFQVRNIKGSAERISDSYTPKDALRLHRWLTYCTAIVAAINSGGPIKAGCGGCSLARLLCLCQAHWVRPALSLAGATWTGAIVPVQYL